MPSTVKWSAESSRRLRASATTSAKNASATSWRSSRSRFFVNVVGVEAAVADVEVEEPLEQQVVLQPLAELALAAHREQRDQQARLQQVLGRDRGTAALGVHLVEQRRQPRQHRLHDRLDAPDRVARRDQLVRRDRQQHVCLALASPRIGHLLVPPAAHHASRADPLPRSPRGVFQQPAASRIASRVSSASNCHHSRGDDRSASVLSRGGDRRADNWTISRPHRMFASTAHSVERLPSRRSRVRDPSPAPIPTDRGHRRQRWTRRGDMRRFRSSSLSTCSSTSRADCILPHGRAVRSGGANDGSSNGVRAGWGRELSNSTAPRLTAHLEIRLLTRLPLPSVRRRRPPSSRSAQRSSPYRSGLSRIAVRLVGVDISFSSK